MAGEWTYESEVDLTNGGLDDTTSWTVASGLASTLLEVQVMVAAVSFDADDTVLILRLGDSGGVETSGYEGSSSWGTSGGGNATASVEIAVDASWDAVDLCHASYSLYRWSAAGFKWLIDARGTEYTAGTMVMHGMSVITLDSALTTLTLTTPAGTAAFDGGTCIVRHR
jgi:hypothetical protein